MTDEAAADRDTTDRDTTDRDTTDRDTTDRDTTDRDTTDRDTTDHNTDELAGRVDEAALAHLHSLEQMVEDKPWMLEFAQRAREELTVRADQGDRLVARRRERLRRGGTPAVSIRLTADDLYALERRAAFIGITPSMLARNLIRVGTAAPYDRDLLTPLTAIEDAVARLRESLSVGRFPPEV